MPSLRQLLQSKSQDAKEKTALNRKVQFRFKGKTRVICITKTPEDEINSEADSLSRLKMHQGSHLIVTTHREMSVDVAVCAKDEANASCVDQTIISSSSLNKPSYVNVTGIGDLPVLGASPGVAGQHSGDFEISMCEKSSPEPKEKSFSETASKPERDACLLPKRRNALYPRHYNRGSFPVTAFSATAQRHQSKSQEMKDRDCLEETKGAFPGQNSVSEPLRKGKAPFGKVFEDIIYNKHQGRRDHNEPRTDSVKENVSLRVEAESDCFNQAFLSSSCSLASIDSVSQDHEQSREDLDMKTVSAHRTAKSDCFDEAFLSSCCSLGQLLNNINHEEPGKKPDTGKTSESGCFNKTFLSNSCSVGLHSINEINDREKTCKDMKITTVVKMSQSGCFDESCLPSSCGLGFHDMNKKTSKNSERDKICVAESDCFNEAFLSSSCSLGLQNISGDCNDCMKTRHHPKTDRFIILEKGESDCFNKAFLSSSCNLARLSSHFDLHDQIKPNKKSEISSKIQEQLNEGFSSSSYRLPGVDLSINEEEGSRESRFIGNTDNEEKTHPELDESIVRNRFWYEAEGESDVSTPVAQSRKQVEEESSSIVEDISVSTTRCTDENTVIDSTRYSFFPNPVYKDLIRQTSEAVFFSCGGFFDRKMSEVFSSDDTNTEKEVLCGDLSVACPVLSSEHADKKKTIQGSVTTACSNKRGCDTANIECSTNLEGTTHISHTDTIGC